METLLKLLGLALLVCLGWYGHAWYVQKNCDVHVVAVVTPKAREPVQTPKVAPKPAPVAQKPNPDCYGPACYYDARKEGGAKAWLPNAL